MPQWRVQQRWLKQGGLAWLGLGTSMGLAVGGKYVVMLYKKSNSPALREKGGRQIFQVPWQYVLAPA